MTSAPIAIGNLGAVERLLMSFRDDVAASPRSFYAWLQTRLGIAVSVVAIVSGWGAFSGNLDAAAEWFVARSLPEEVRLAIDAAGARSDQLDQRLDEVSDRLARLERTLQSIADAREQEKEPVLEFARSGHSISDAEIGQFVFMEWRFFRMRADCGSPQVSLFFRDGRNALHQFEPPSSLRSGRGYTAEAMPGIAQSVRYPARIPPAAGVVAGRAVGWVESSYPACPQVAPAISPEVQFTIFEPLAPSPRGIGGNP